MTFRSPAVRREMRRGRPIFILKRNYIRSEHVLGPALGAQGPRTWESSVLLLRPSLRVVVPIDEPNECAVVGTPEIGVHGLDLVVDRLGRV